MAESAESLMRRGMISEKQGAKLGILKGTKNQPSKMAAFDEKSGKRDQGGRRDKGPPEAGNRHIDKSQSADSVIAGKPSKGGFVNGGQQPKVNHIDDGNFQSPPFPAGGKVKGGNMKGFASKQKGKIAKQGGEYGGPNSRADG